ncbi:MAG: hypothetical protein ABR924_00430 [Terracidiphilus sp.]|jgi:uncharacterized membrane protein
MMSDPNQSGLSDKAAGGIAYLTFIPALFFLISPTYKRRPEVRFHSWQSAYLWVTGLIVWVVLSIFGKFPPLGGFFAFSINLLMILLISAVAAFLFFILWVIATLNAFKGQRFKIAVIGNMAEKRADI